MKKYFYLFFILLFPSLLYIYLSKAQHHYKYLPYFGEKTLEKLLIDGKEVEDTLYHTVSDFALTNQYGEAVSMASFKDQILVAEFFFTNCSGICIKMNQEMNRVHLLTKKLPDVTLLSFTVDPQRDTVDQLLNYSAQFSPEKGKWHFITGAKEDLYRLAQKGFLISADETTDSIPDFIHDEHFVLVDKQRRIRGFYKGTEEAEINRLLDEIKVLRAEEFVVKKTRR